VLTAEQKKQARCAVLWLTRDELRVLLANALKLPHFRGRQLPPAVGPFPIPEGAELVEVGFSDERPGLVGVKLYHPEFRATPEAERHPSLRD
jgi:hypothetical protein